MLKKYLSKNAYEFLNFLKTIVCYRDKYYYLCKSTLIKNIYINIRQKNLFYRLYNFHMFLYLYVYIPSINNKLI